MSLDVDDPAETPLEALSMSRTEDPCSPACPTEAVVVASDGRWTRSLAGRDGEVVVGTEPEADLVGTANGSRTNPSADSPVFCTESASIAASVVSPPGLIFPALFSSEFSPVLLVWLGESNIGAPICSVLARECGRSLGRRDISDLKRAPALACNQEKGNSVSSKTTSLEM